MKEVYVCARRGYRGSRVCGVAALQWTPEVVCESSLGIHPCAALPRASGAAVVRLQSMCIKRKPGAHLTLEEYR